MTWHSPLDSLAIMSGELLLRPVRDADIDQLAASLPDDFDLDPACPPIPQIPTAQDRQRRFVQSLWRHRGSWSIEQWALDFGVWRGGNAIGIQTLEGTHFPVDRTVDTASWIANPFRGNGFGRHARSAVLAFAFQDLQAQQAISSAATTNHASLAVSRRLGYQDAGVRPHATSDGVIDLQHLALARDDWLTGDARITVSISGFDACRPLFGVDY